MKALALGWWANADLLGQNPDALFLKYLLVCPARRDRYEHTGHQARYQCNRKFSFTVPTESVSCWSRPEQPKIEFQAKTFWWLFRRDVQIARDTMMAV